MKLQHLRPEQIVTSSELARTSHSKQFEERLLASLDAIGLAEPIKVAKLPVAAGGESRYVIIDGVIRWRAIDALRAKDPKRFKRIPAYVHDFGRRFEIRYQSDIYQDLLPSQLAALVEHLHQAEHIAKGEIAEFIGVSAATLRNYTGLWRLVQRGGLFGDVVRLMDVGVLPASNPFAWLRLTEAGLRYVFEEHLANGGTAECWIAQRLDEVTKGIPRSLPLKYVEAITGALPAKYYREDERVREMKKNLGLRRAAKSRAPVPDLKPVLQHLDTVAVRSSDPVLRSAAQSLKVFIK